VFVTLTLDTFFAGATVYIGLAGLLAAGYALFVLARGYLAGRRRYRAYGVATAGESLLRLIVAVVAVTIAADAVSLGVAMVIAPLATLALRPFYRSTAPAVPYAETSTASSASSKAGFFLGSLVVANAASQALLGSAPLLAGAFGADEATVSVVFVTFALFRGPIWIVQGAAARMLPPLTALARRDDIPALTRWVRRIAAAGRVLTALGFVGGLLLGPAVVRLLFGAEFDPPRLLTALAACASALAAVALVSGQILIATGRTGRLAMAWLTALPGAALVAWATPVAPDVRVGVALVAGEATAVVLAVVWALLLSSQAGGIDGTAGEPHDARAPGGR
jgi:O-antigen/teichoic acid export membrane protein